MTEVCILGGPGDVRDFEGGGFDVNDMEYGLHVARVIHRDLVRLNASAWHWWLAVTPYDYKDGLIRIDTDFDPKSLRPSKVFWVLGNFSRFVRPGFQRIELSGADELNGLMASAYQSPDQKTIVMVVVNASEHQSELIINTTGLADHQSLEFDRKYVTNSDGSLSMMASETSKTIIAPKSVATFMGTLQTKIQ